MLTFSRPVVSSRWRSSRFQVATLLMLGILLVSLLPTATPELTWYKDKKTQSSPLTTPKNDEATVKASMANLPLSFELNQGQQPDEVKFFTRSEGYTLFLNNAEMVISLNDESNHPEKATTKAAFGSSSLASSLTPASFASKKMASQNTVDNPAVVRTRFVGANPQAQITGLGEQEGKTNYFYGSNPLQWKTNVPNYSQVKYQQLYQGIDLIFYTAPEKRQLEYDFVVQPGANPALINLELSGVERAKLDELGNLVLTTKNGPLVHQAPVIYQLENGVRQTVSGKFKLEDRGNASYLVSFELGQYDQTRALTIDPGLIYSTFLGGTGLDSIGDIAIDSSGSAYVIGETSSVDFPVTPGVYQTIKPSGPNTWDAFVTKVKPDGSGIVYSSFLGGNALDYGFTLTIDNQGYAYLTGLTLSNDFPVTPGAFQTIISASGQSSFITKLNPAGSGLVYSTYFAGNDSTVIRDVALSNTGDLYLTGFGNSLPATPGVIQPNFAGGANDAFVGELRADGSGLVYATFLGGALDDYAYSIALDNSGNAYVTGNTSSAEFPVTPGAFQSTFIGNFNTFNTFVAKVNSNGTALIYSTFLGGTGKEGFSRLVIDSSGSAYVTGETTSVDFPTTSGVFQPTAPGGVEQDGYLVKLRPDGSGLVFSTFLGGTKDDSPRVIRLDSSGNIYVAGDTRSSDFPVTLGAYQTSSASAPNTNTYDIFITKFKPDGTGLNYSTYFGGSSNDNVSDIAVDNNENVYFTGDTASFNFPVTPGAFQTSTVDQGVAFVAKLSTIVVPPPPTVTPPAMTPTPSGTVTPKAGLPADPIVQLRISPDRLVSTDVSQQISFTFRILNSGPGKAQNLQLSLSLDPNLDLGYALFSDPRSWVTSVTTTTLSISLPALEKSHELTGTIVFRPSPTAQAGAVIAKRLKLGWDDDERSGKQTVSNLERFALSSDGTTLDVSQGAVELFKPEQLALNTGEKAEFVADLYIPDEIVTTWLTRPDGTSLPLGSTRAGPAGLLQIKVDTTALAPGTYSVAGYGNRSEVTGTGVLIITG